MSISGRLGSSSLCRKLEYTRPMREEVNGKVVFFFLPQSRRFHLDLLVMQFFFLIVPLTWHLNNDVSCQGKCMNRRNESKKHNCSSLFSRILTIIPSIISFSYLIYWNCKKDTLICFIRKTY